MIQYEDFSLKLEPQRDDRYPVIVLRSPAGEGRSWFRLPFEPGEIGDVLFDLGQTVRGSGQAPLREASPAATRTRPQKIGDQLFNALFSGPVRRLLDRSLGMVGERQHGLRIKLHIDPEDPSLAKLASLPWELMYSKDTRDFLNLSRFTPVLRYLDVQRPYVPLPLEPPLRILVVISSPTNYQELDLKKECGQIRDSWARQEGVQVEFVDQATILALQDRLAERPYHVLHYMGHGGFERHTGSGVLIMEDGDGRGAPVDGNTLGVLLRDVPTLRLVFLNACETARVTQQAGLDPFAGVAASMVMAGIPAVVAMQFPITDVAAIRFANRFYPLVARGNPVDYAVAEGRRAIRLAESGTMEWATPVLFMRAPEGVIFDVTEGQRVERPLPELPELDEELEQRLEELYTVGLGAFWLEDWDRAVRHFQTIVDVRPDYEDAAGKLAESQRQARLQSLYAQAQAARDAEDWPGARAVLGELVAEAPDYKDAAALLEWVRRKKQLADLYAEAQRLHQAGQWQAVVNVFAQIQALEPDYADPDGLLPTAEEAFAEQQRQEKLKSLHGRALRTMDAGRWAAAQQLLSHLIEAEPGYGDAQRLLSRVEAELAREEADRQRQEQIAVLYAQAQQAAAAGQWLQALARMGEIQDLDPNFPDPEEIASRAQEEVQRQERLGELYRQAQVAREAEDWPAAIAALEPLVTEAPDFEDAAALLEAAKRQQQLAGLYAEAQEQHEAGQWQAVVETFALIAAIAPDHPDPDGLLPSAQKEMVAQKRRAEVEDLYGRALQAVEAGHWEEARQLLAQVQEREPGFRETGALLAQVDAEIERAEAKRRQQEQVATLYEQALGLARARQWRAALAKMEEIGAQDPDFADPEGIASQAQTQIAVEEEEARRQDELAALYAEAVRLVRAGQYQEALEKWGEVQALQPHYPDRKKVQATARKKLAALSKPAAKRHLPAWAVAAIGGLAVITIVVAVLLLSDGLGGGGTPEATRPVAPVAAAATVTAQPTHTSRPADTAAPASGEPYFNEGSQLLEQGQYEQAIAQFDQALALGWDTAELYHNRAWACHEWQNSGGECSCEQAIPDWSKAIERDPQNEDSWRERGWCYLSQGDYRAAIDDFDEVIELRPQQASAYIGRGMASRLLGDGNQAIADLNKAVELEPGDPDAYWERALYYGEQGQEDEARADYEKFLELTEGDPAFDDRRADATMWLAGHPKGPSPTPAPVSGESYFNEGSQLLEQGQYEQAIAQFDQALDLGWETAELYLARAQACHNEGSCTYEQAIDDYTKAIDLDPQNADYWEYRGGYYLDQGNYQAAIRDCDQAIELDPQHLWAHITRGQSYEQLGDSAQALENFNKAVEVAPNDATPYGLRAAYYGGQGQKDLAVDDYTKAIDLDPQNADYWEYRGGCYFDQGNYQAAIRDCDQAIELDPQHLWAHITRGQSYEQLGDSAQALENFNKAVELAPEDPNAFWHRGVYYGGQGQWEEQIADMTQVLLLDADNPAWYSAYAERGDAYAQLGQVAEARADYETFLDLTEGDPAFDDRRADATMWLAGHAQGPSPTPTRTSAPTAAPTPLPGSETVPLDQMAPSIPWLPMERRSGVMAIYFNVTKPPFDDRRVRQAFALAVNRAQVAGLARAHGWDATPATTFTPPDVLGRDLYQQVGLPSNPERARKLLAEAGYPGGAGFPQVTIVSNSAELNEAMIHEIAGMWRANLGVDVQVEFMEVWDDYLARLANDPPPLFRLGWLQDERDPHERLGSFHSAHENNHALFADPEYDQLVEDAQAAADDPPLRQALYIQAERILCEQEAAIIPLWHWLAEQ